ncbi:MAG: aerobic carbon-monoxide dehydrogenase large subunit [Solirubrobacteraceae bacterium]|nr:aerobic carbon-monoxide dehydrogenase large subunit [Gaiellaceae bacterium]MEA2247706.1 aerobic carbon-monoxide dehydrogenase large subunit [Solirubrobacteraceae bacterium]
MSVEVRARERTTWVGARRKRVEDRRILVGGARYTDDFDPPGVLEVAFVRSAMPHARISSIDTSAAAHTPGVHAVFTGADLRRLGFGELAVKWIYDGQRCLSQPLFATDKVRFVGEPVAAVVAESRYVAEDAAEQILVDYEPLDPVVDVKSAIAAGATRVFDDWDDNVMVRAVLGGGDFERAAAEADLVLREEFASHRHTAVPLEGRGAVASLDALTGILSIHTSNQAPHRAKTHIAEYLRWPEHRVRVIAPDVGGGFGVKDRAAVEEVFVALAATQLGRPVKWVEDRREHFVSTNHAREQVHQVEVYVRRDGRILGLRDRLLSDIGAYASTAVGIGPTITSADLLPGPYDIQSYEVELLAVATNKVPSGGYRGFGQPQATFVMERIIDRVAAELGIDPAEVRRRNFIAPDAFPFTTATQVTYDSGDYETALNRALELLDYDRWRTRQAAANNGARLIGIGLSSIVEMTGEGPSPAFGRRGSRISGYEHASVELDSQGCATVSLGLSPQGQGHQTVFAQVCADELGIHPERVRVVQGDTAMTPYAVAGAIGSRGATLGGAAVITACRRLRTRLLRMAGHMLTASAEDLEIVDGFVCGRHDPQVELDLAHVASELLLGHDLPEGLDPGLVEHAIFDPTSLAFSFGTHAAVVEVDVDTGLLDILDYVIVYDAGRVINPLIVEGQLVGGLAQGVGAALLEELVYDADGQLTTTTFMDYLLPTSVEVPSVRVELMETPAPFNPGGIKGVGQGSTIAAPAAIANAVEDALRSRGAVVRRTPLSPDVIWSLARDRSVTPDGGVP